MLYARVIVRKKTKAEELTYLVPAQIVPHLQIGSLVVVPLRRSVTEGVVVGLTSSVSASLRSRLKEILDLDRHQPIYRQAELQAIRRLARYYAASLAEVAFQALSVKTRKWLAPLINQLEKRQLTERRRYRPIFIQGGWPDRRQAYYRLIEKYGGDSNLLFIFSQRALAEDFYRNLPSSLRLRTVDDLTNRSINRSFSQLLATQRRFVLVTTLSGAFCPLQTDDIIVVDQPYHPGGKQRFRPFMTTSTIAQIRAGVEQLRLVLGGELISVEDYARIQAKTWRLYQPRRQSTLPLTIVSRRNTSEVMMSSVLEELKDLIRAGGRVLILVAARGWAPAVLCKHCGAVVACGRCGQTISLNAERKLECRYCGFSQPYPKRCEECHDPALKALGEGVAAVADYLKAQLPETAIKELSAQRPLLEAEYQVVIATEKIYSFPEARFELVILASIDRLLTASQLNGNWQLANLIVALRSQAPRLVVQTYLPEHPLWTIIAQGNWQRYFDDELAVRRELRLPPFGSLFAIRGQGGQLTELREQAAKIAQAVAAILPLAVVTELQVQQATTHRSCGSVTVYFPGNLTTPIKQQLRSIIPPAWQLDLDYR